MRRWLCICSCLCLASCSNPYGDHPPHPVSGQLLINGKPAAGAQILLIHLGDWGGRFVVPKATTDEEGRFTLSTYAMEDGAPVGEYEVEINWPAYRRGKNIGPDRLGGKFADHKTSGVKVKIDETTGDLPITLSAKITEVKEPEITRPGSKGKDRRGDRY